jgi:hypothetical protein
VVKRRPQEWLYRVAIYQSARRVCIPRCNCWLAETYAWLATGSNSRRKQQWSIAITVQPANNGKRTCKLPRRCSPTNQSNYQSESLCANEGLELIDRSFISTCLCSPPRELFIIPKGIIVDLPTHTHTHTQKLWLLDHLNVLEMATPPSRIKVKPPERGIFPLDHDGMGTVDNVFCTRFLFICGRLCKGNARLR